MHTVNYDRFFRQIPSGNTGQQHTDRYKNETCCNHEVAQRTALMLEQGNDDQHRGHHRKVVCSFPETIQHSVLGMEWRLLTLLRWHPDGIVSHFMFSPIIQLEPKSPQTIQNSNLNQIPHILDDKSTPRPILFPSIPSTSPTRAPFLSPCSYLGLRHRAFHFSVCKLRARSLSLLRLGFRMEARG